jgi:hypothetical protein
MEAIQVIRCLKCFKGFIDELSQEFDTMTLIIHTASEDDLFKSAGCLQWASVNRIQKNDRVHRHFILIARFDKGDNV